MRDLVSININCCCHRIYRFMPQYFSWFTSVSSATWNGFRAVLCIETLFRTRLELWLEKFQLPKAVAIISPHTSNIDGWYGFLAIGGLGLKITVFGKDYLNHPLESILNWAGFVPVTRDSTNGLTEQVVATITIWQNLGWAWRRRNTKKSWKNKKWLLS